MKGGKMRSRAKWTVMVYMAGDNNLESAAMVDLKEMAKVGSTSDVNIVVQLDRERDNITKRIRVLKKGHTSPTLLLPETDTGDPGPYRFSPVVRCQLSGGPLHACFVEPRWRLVGR